MTMFERSTKKWQIEIQHVYVGATANTYIKIFHRMLELHMLLQTSIYIAYNEPITKMTHKIRHQKKHVLIRP